MKCSICGEELDEAETPCPNCSEDACADVDGDMDATDERLAEDSLGVEDTLLPEAFRKAQRELAESGDIPPPDEGDPA